MNLLIKKLDFIEPFHIFTQVADLFGTVFLDSNLINTNYCRYSFIVVNPIEIYNATNTEHITTQLNTWKELFNKNKHCYNKELPPFIGGLVGFLSYDLSAKLEVISDNNKIILPDYLFGLYNQVFAFDLLEKTCYIIVNKINGYSLDYNKQFNDLINIYNNAQLTPVNLLTNKLPQVNLQSNFTHDEYINTVIKAQQYIRDGDIFEVNIVRKEYDNRYRWAHETKMLIVLCI